MNEFMISFLNTESALDRMQRVESEIRSEKEETSRIRSGFHSEFAGKERILRNLRTQIDNLGDLCDSARTFHTSLGTIIRLYTAMEENLLGQFEIPADGTSARSGTSAEDAESASERTENTERTESTAPKEEPKDMFSNVEIVPFAILGPNRRKDRKDEEKQADSSEKGESAEVSADNGGAPDTKDQPPINGPGLEDLEPAVNPFFPQLIPPDDSKVKTWEDFIALLPAGLLEKLPEEAVEYLRQLFEFFKSKEMPFGQVRFPGWDEIVTNSMWAAFLAAIMWYFYQNGVIPSPAAEDGKRLPEDGKEPEAKAEEEEEKEEQEEKKLSEDEEAAQE
ncbi:MAG: hypothetical protein Q4D81_01300, partial [Eubacteriales bacterium]|nr:hypothetical protein [Eubacteriales bacterium]